MCSLWSCTAQSVERGACNSRIVGTVPGGPAIRNQYERMTERLWIKAYNKWHIFYYSTFAPSRGTHMVLFSTDDLTLLSLPSGKPFDSLTHEEEPLRPHIDSNEVQPLSSDGASVSPDPFCLSLQYLCCNSLCRGARVSLLYLEYFSCLLSRLPLILSCFLSFSSLRGPEL